VSAPQSFFTVNAPSPSYSVYVCEIREPMLLTRCLRFLRPPGCRVFPREVASSGPAFFPASSSAPPLVTGPQCVSAASCFAGLGSGTHYLFPSSERFCFKKRYAFFASDCIRTLSGCSDLCVPVLRWRWPLVFSVLPDSDNIPPWLTEVAVACFPSSFPPAGVIPGPCSFFLCVPLCFP